MSASYDGLMTTSASNNSVGNITTVGSCGDYWPWQQQWPTTIYPTPTITLTAQPQECSGDVHVFPCPRCEKCKCGKATVKRERKSK